MPVTPAIAFGIMSRRVTLAGAGVSVLVGILIAAVFVVDQLIGPAAGSKVFPWLHHTLTLNYTYRGLWGTLVIIAVLFGVSAVTPGTDPEKLKKTTVDWGRAPEAFRGLADWRFQFAVLSVITVAAYAFLW